MLALMTVASILTVIVSYNLSDKQLRAATQYSGAFQAEYLQSMLWQLDAQAIREHLELGVLLGEFIAAEVRDQAGDVYLAAGTMGSVPNALSVSFPLYHKAPTGRLEIGTFSVEVSRAELWQVARSRVAALLVISTVAAFFSLWISNRSLNRTLLNPIVAVARELRETRSNWEDLDLSSYIGQNGSVIREFDELASSIHIMRDKILESERKIKRDQLLLAQAAQLAGLGYCTANLSKGTMLSCSDTHAAMHGMTPEAMMALDLEADFVEGLVHPDDRSAVYNILTDSDLGEGKELTVRLMTSKGIVRYIHAVYRVAETAEGADRILELVSQDVTDFYETEENLRHAQKTQAIGKLTGGVAHDFNNILAIISGNLELLRDDPSPEFNDGYIGTALQAVARGATLTQQLLAFARKQALSPEVLDPFQLIRDSASLLRTSVGETIELEFVADGGRWSTKADKGQLENTILNMVVNARDAMPGGGKLTIEVSNARLDQSYAAAHAEVEPGQYVCIAVTDSGTGMSTEVLQRATEPFFTTKEVGKGTGMGLSMAFGFAKQSGGHLKLYSEPGHGTTVKLYLPRVPSEKPEVPFEKGAVRQGRLDNLSIFVVEDEDSLRNTLAAQLRSLGCVVHTAADGQSALELAGRTPQVDVVLTDVILPGGMDGRQVAQQLERFFPSATVLYMSGFTENSIIHNGRLDNGVIMIQKPFSKSDLVVAIRRALRP